MATRAIANGGGNWNSTGTWVEGAVPVAGDAVVATATSGQLTVNVASACASIILTNYANTLTFNASLTVTSTVTFVAGMNIAGTTGALICNGTLTLTSAGKTLTNGLSLQGANTYTLADDWTVNGVVTVGTASNALTITGAKNLNCAGGLGSSTTAVVTFTGLTAINLTGGTWSGVGTATFSGNININGNITLASTLKFGGGTLAYLSGSVSTGTAVLNIRSSCTLSLGMLALFNITIGVAALTITLGTALTVSTLTLPDGACTFAGSFDITVGTFNAVAITTNRTFTVVAGQKINVTLAIVFSTAQTLGNNNRAKFVSSSPGTKWSLILANGATQNLIYADFTDCDATGGQQVFSAGGSVTTCFNVYNTFPVPRAYPSSQLGVQ